MNLDADKKDSFIQQNSPDGGFLQSPEWSQFQKSVGRKTYCIAEENLFASIVEHSLPIVGKYFYIPRGPMMGAQSCLDKIINLAKENKVSWIRIEPASENLLKLIKEKTEYKIVKAPHDVQPKEILLIDITKSEEELLAEMKPKTRYNIRLAQKHEVSVSVITNNQGNYIEEFLRLVKITAKRDNISPHPDNYYRKMFKAIPGENLKLYVAEYQRKIIAANLIIFYGKVATYLHGASDSEYRNVMAPYLLQWQAILDAKKSGCEKYDLGGVATKISNNWSGITRFKTGFSPNTQPIIFPGSYDIITDRKRYYLYGIIQKIKCWIR